MERIKKIASFISDHGGPGGGCELRRVGCGKDLKKGFMFQKSAQIVYGRTWGKDVN